MLFRQQQCGKEANNFGDAQGTVCSLRGQELVLVS